MRFFMLCVFSMLFVLSVSQSSFAEIVVNWANNSTAGGVNATLSPDGQLASLGDAFPSITMSNFAVEKSYSNLESLLNVPFATLDSSSIIAWEGNGGSAAVGGGWEATRFIVFDSMRSVTIDHKEGLIAPGVIATGTVEGSQYDSFFGLASGTAQAKMSWILLSKSIENFVDTRSAFFGIQMTAGHSLGFSGEGTADPDAIGVLVTAVPEPSSIALIGMLIVLVAFVRILRRSGGRVTTTLQWTA